MFTTPSPSDYRVMFLFGMLCLVAVPGLSADDIKITEDDQQITIETSAIKAAIRKQGYVSGVAAGSFIDKQTGAHDLGFGLDIVDWIMEPGSDEQYRDQLEDELVGVRSTCRQYAADGR